MKGLLLVVLLSSCITANAGRNPELDPSLTLLSEQPTDLVLSFTAQGLETKTVQINGHDFLDFSLFNEGYATVEGLPALPAVTRVLIIPNGGEVEVDILLDDVDVIAATAPPAPFHSDPAVESTHAIPACSANLSAVYPTDVVSVGSSQTFRGVRLAPVTIHPVQYDAVNQTYLIHRNLETAIRVKPTDGVMISNVEELLPKRMTRDTYKFLHALAFNGPQRDDGGERLPRGGYLIATALSQNQVESHINRLADWQRACGRHVEIVFNEDNGSNLKNDEITDGYRNWDPPLEFVCIVGPFNEGAPNNDVTYGCLDGNNDHIPEVAIGRLGATYPDQANVVISRALNYQRDPWRGNNMTWFDRAGAMANSVGRRTPAVDHTITWIAEAERRAGFPNVMWFSADGGQGTPHEWMSNGGLNVVFERGFSRNIAINGQFNPVYISVGGGHIPAQVDQIWNYGSPNQPIGPSVMTGTGHNPSTLPCNVLCGGMARGLLIEKLPLGWARALAMLMLDYTAPGTYSGFTREYRVLGEPSQRVWLGRPTELSVQFDDVISPERNSYDVNVSRADNDDPVSNALVTLTQPGELLAFGFTDENGFCQLLLPEGIGGNCTITVTGEGLLTFHDDVAAQESQLYVYAVIENINDEQNGNNDGVLNPGETAFLTVSARNASNRVAAHNVTGVLSSTTPWMSCANIELHFGDIDAQQTIQAEETVAVTMVPSVFEGSEMGFRVQLTGENGVWDSYIRAEYEAPCLALRSLHPGVIVEPRLMTFDVRLENTGSLDSAPMTAELATESQWIQIVDPFDTYPAMETGQSARSEGDHFEINPSPLAPPGLQVPLMLLLRTDEEAPADTISFTLQISQPRRTGPNGPDDYGYVCFDNTDVDWERAPSYNWIEINPSDRDCDYEGAILRNQGNGQDQTWVVNLPFPFQFYGQDYEQITVSENGFIAMGGDLNRCIMYENSPLDKMINGSFGMIAPYWDNLNVSANGAGIFTCYAEPEHAFIVEWFNIPCVGSNTRLTFQIKLLDEEFNPVIGDDGLVEFHYKTVPEINRGEQPEYCSVGICSPNGSIGINYFSGNVYPAASAPVANQRALLFTTSPEAARGVVYGNVIDAATNLPMENVLILTSYGQVAYTDANGDYSIQDAWALPFDITASKQGWNDSTLTDFELEEGQSIEINFGLLHPEFISSDWVLHTEIDPDMMATVWFTLTNTGNGPLDWIVEKRLLGDANAAPWEFRRTYPFGALVDDSRIKGVAFIDNEFYVSGANDNDPCIYVFNREGDYLRSFPQPRLEDDNLGMRDLTWDGQLIWGCTGLRNNQVYGITKEGELVRQFTGPYDPSTAITWDPEHEVLWISSTTTNPVAYTREGEPSELGSIPRQNLRIYGLAYWTEDPDGCGLYIYHKERDTDNFTIHKVNVEIPDDIRFVTYLFPEEGGQPEGCFITKQFDVYSWVIMTISNLAGDDRINVWQLEARRDWFMLDVIENGGQIDADSGRINTGESRSFILDFNSTELPDTLFEAELLFHHNADSGRAHIAVAMRVLGDLPPPHFGLRQPPHDSSVDGPRVTFSWDPAVDPNPLQHTNYTLSIIADGNLTQIVTDEPAIEVNLDTLDVDLNWLRRNFATWSVTATSEEDVVECNQPFRFMLEAPPSDFELIAPPNLFQLSSYRVIFAWNQSFDPNPDDNVEYLLWIETGGDSASVRTSEFNANIALDSLGLSYDAAWPVTWWVDALSDRDTVECAQRFLMTFPPDGLFGPASNIPAEFSIGSVHPNPFNALTSIVFGADRSEPLCLRAFDVSGRQVAVLYQGRTSPGWHQVVWNAADLPTGVYMLRLEAAGRVKIAKTALVK